MFPRGSRQVSVGSLEGCGTTGGAPAPGRFGSRSAVTRAVICSSCSTCGFVRDLQVGGRPAPPADLRWTCGLVAAALMIRVELDGPCSSEFELEVAPFELIRPGRR